MGRIFYVNGDYVDEADARISVLDRGFLFADAVYEVTSVLDGRLIDNAAHLRRLARSLGELRIPAPGSDEEITAIQSQLIQRNALREGLVYLQVSRGVADRDFAFPVDAEPGLVMFTQAKTLIDNPLATTGLRIITVDDLRWKRRDIKTVGLLGPCLGKQAALRAGVHDAWMVEDGLVTEGTSNNAYIVTDDGVIRTRQLGCEILSGITRAAVLKFAQESGMSVDERPFTVQEAKDAREAFITSASMFVMPVVEIDGEPVGDGQVGAVTRRLREIYIDTARQRDSL